MEGLAALYLSISTVGHLHRKDILSREEVMSLWDEAAKMLESLETETPAQEQLKLGLWFS